MKKIQLNVDDFLPILAQMASVSGAQKNPMPILDKILFETQNGKLYLTASDNDNVLCSAAKVMECEDGIKCCIDAKNINKAISNLAGKLVEMAFDEEKELVSCQYENGHFELPFVGWEEFPIANDVQGEDSVEKTIDTKQFLAAMKRVSFAVSNEDIRPIMCGVHFDFAESGMIAVATDTKKLVKYTDASVSLNDGEQATGVTIPRRAVSVMQNILDAFSESGLVKLVFNDKFIVLRNQNFKLSARLIEGRFPNYNSVIPKKTDKSADISKTYFISALKRVMAMSNKATELVKLNFENDKLTINYEDIDFSKYATEVISCQYDANLPSFNVGFKGSYLLQMLQGVEGEDVLMQFTDATKPCIFQPSAQDGNTEYTSILMPIQLTD